MTSQWNLFPQEEMGSLQNHWQKKLRYIWNALTERNEIDMKSLWNHPQKKNEMDMKPPTERNEMAMKSTHRKKWNGYEIPPQKEMKWIWNPPTERNEMDMKPPTDRMRYIWNTSGKEWNSSVLRLYLSHIICLHISFHKFPRQHVHRSAGNCLYCMI